jgi:hypothetical protein
MTKNTETGTTRVIMTDRERYMALSRAVDLHRQLIERGEVSHRAASNALYLVTEMLAGRGCTGGCCG